MANGLNPRGPLGKAAFCYLQQIIGGNVGQFFRQDTSAFETYDGTSFTNTKYCVPLN